MIRVAAFLLLASPADAQDLDVQFQDGNPFDRFIVFNRGCPLANATITLDFTTSKGGILIDTAYGGLGARDPMDVTLTEGNATLREVKDGDQIIRLDVATLPTVSAITVTMDVDDSVGLFEDARVYADGAEVDGTTVSITLNADIVTTTLDNTGQGKLIIPPSMATCPIS